MQWHIGQLKATAGLALSICSPAACQNTSSHGIAASEASQLLWLKHMYPMGCAPAGRDMTAHRSRCVLHLSEVVGTRAIHAQVEVSSQLLGAAGAAQPLLCQVPLGIVAYIYSAALGLKDCSYIAYDLLAEYCHIGSEHSACLRAGTCR